MYALSYFLYRRIFCFHSNISLSLNTNVRELYDHHVQLMESHLVSSTIFILEIGAI